MELFFFLSCFCVLYFLVFNIYFSADEIVVDNWDINMKLVSCSMYMTIHNQCLFPHYSDIYKVMLNCLWSICLNLDIHATKPTFVNQTALENLDTVFPEAWPTMTSILTTGMCVVAIIWGKMVIIWNITNGCIFLCFCNVLYCQLRARRALSIFKDVPLRTRRALSLYIHLSVQSLWR